MDSYEERLKKCIEEINVVQNEMTTEEIKKDADAILECFENARHEMHQMINEQGIVNMVYDKCDVIFSKHAKLISDKAQHMQHLKTNNCNWYVGLNDDIIKRQVESKESYRKECINKVKCQLYHVLGVFAIVLIAAILGSSLIIPKLFVLLEQPQEIIIQFNHFNLYFKKDIGQIGLFGFYFTIVLLVIFQALIFFCAYKVLPRMYKRIRQLFSLITIIKTSAVITSTNVQRELELIMKS